MKRQNYTNEHTIDFLQYREKTRVTQNRNMDWWLKRIVKQFEVTFALSLIVTVIVLLVFVVKKSQHGVFFPLSNVVVTGDSNFTTQKDIENVLVGQLPESFVDINTDEVKSLILDLPWITDVSVTKHWPGKIKVSVTERTPLMRWGDNQVIDSDGVVFKTSHNQKMLDNLMKKPKLIGAESKGEEVLAGFIIFSKAFPEYEALKVESFEHTSQLSWNLYLANGVTVRFGKKHLNARAKRLAVAYRTKILTDLDNIDVIYLSYARGLSIAYKPEASSEKDKDKSKTTRVVLESI